MADLVVIVKSRSFRRYAAVAVWAAAAAALVAVCARRSEVRPYAGAMQSEVSNDSPPQNEIRNFTCYRYDPESNKLSFAASVGSLRAENATIGVFRTAAARAVRIRDLQLWLSGDRQWGAMAGTAAAGAADAPAGRSAAMEDLLDGLLDARDRLGVDIDLSNTQEVTVENLDYRVFDEDRLALRVRSKRAAVSSARQEVELRGRVTVTAHDGSTLVSNHIRWDTRRQNFTADGTYLLRRGDRQITGRGSCVDSNLNILSTKSAMK